MTVELACLTDCKKTSEIDSVCFYLLVLQVDIMMLDIVAAVVVWCLMRLLRLLELKCERLAWAQSFYLAPLSLIRLQLSLITI